MTTETGQISIHAENILPIIKRWLYSEKEIFIRELVANAADAVSKNCGFWAKSNERLKTPK